MIWHSHSEIEKNTHAIFAPSKHSWMHQEPDEIIKTYVNSFSTEIGTILHDFAKYRIIEKKPLYDEKSGMDAVYMYLRQNGIPRSVIDISRYYTNLLNYVNDAIGYRMDPEQFLCYHPQLQKGTVDAISFYRKKLRIHDLKTGSTPASMDQLKAYAGLFFLEYGKELGASPDNTKIELRIYQTDNIFVSEPAPEEISEIMNQIKRTVSLIEDFNSEV